MEISGGDFDKLGLSHVPATGLLHPGNMWLDLPKEQLFSKTGELFPGWRDSVGFTSALEESYA